MARLWNGRRVTRAVAYVIRRDNGICWICSHPGANSLDHRIPVSIRPDLEWTPSNWSAAHRQRAGTPGGCDHPGCTCIGNVPRKARDLGPPPSRAW
jgi:hypothetical protein